MGERGPYLLVKRRHVRQRCGYSRHTLSASSLESQITRSILFGNRSVLEISVPPPRGVGAIRPIEPLGNPSISVPSPALVPVRASVPSADSSKTTATIAIGSSRTGLSLLTGKSSSQEAQFPGLPRTSLLGCRAGLGLAPYESSLCDKLGVGR